MIFQLGKNRPNIERKIQNQTLSRWRQLSIQSESKTEDVPEASEPADTSCASGSWSIGNGEYVRLIKPGNGNSNGGNSNANAQLIPQPYEPESELEPVSASEPMLLVEDSEQAKEPQATVKKEEPVKIRQNSSQIASNVRTALGLGTLIDGKFSFDAPVRIDGDLSGEVTSTSALIVGEQASIDADIKVGSLIVFGKVTGSVKVRDLVEIRAGGSLEADIEAERIVVEDGGFFNGHCRMI